MSEDSFNMLGLGQPHAFDLVLCSIGPFRTPDPSLIELDEIHYTVQFLAVPQGRHSH